MKKWLAILIILALSSALLPAACGGDDEDQFTPTPIPGDDRDQFTPTPTVTPPPPPTVTLTPAPVECKEEGEAIPVIPNPPECCEGLTLIPPKVPKLPGITGICTAKCGDGICDPETETNFNCWQDCEPPTPTPTVTPPPPPTVTLTPTPLECKKEGEAIPLIWHRPECCAGLTLIPPKSPDIIGITGICTAKCGNGICDSETETNFNCPQDCGKEPTPPTRVPADLYPDLMTVDYAYSSGLFNTTINLGLHISIRNDAGADAKDVEVTIQANAKSDGSLVRLNGRAEVVHQVGAVAGWDISPRQIPLTIQETNSRARSLDTNGILLKIGARWDRGERTCEYTYQRGILVRHPCD